MEHATILMRRVFCLNSKSAPDHVHRVSCRHSYYSCTSPCS
eukprot:Gb_34167 [translate_table: standard]